MYTEFFGLREAPFNNTPDPRFFFSTPDHEEALASLIYAVQERKGFVVLTGEVGTGKTLISRMMLRHFGGGIAFANINHNLRGATDLLETLCAEFEIPIEARCSQSHMVRGLHDFLLARFAQDVSVVLVLDEAQSLPHDAFEQLRTVGNLEADDAKLLQVVIVGQPELQERFSSPELRQLKQRVFRAFHLPALSRSAVAGYIAHRISVAGGQGAEIFEKDAVELIFEYTQGLPRLINTVCDNAMLSGYSADRRRIDRAFVRCVLDQMIVTPTSTGPSDPSSRCREVEVAKVPAPRSRVDSGVERTPSFVCPVDEDQSPARGQPLPLGTSNEVRARVAIEREPEVPWDLGPIGDCGPASRSEEGSSRPWVSEPRIGGRQASRAVEPPLFVSPSTGGVDESANRILERVRTATETLRLMIDRSEAIAARTEVACTELTNHEARVSHMSTKLGALLKEVRRVYDGMRVVSLRCTRQERRAAEMINSLVSQSNRAWRQTMWQPRMNMGTVSETAAEATAHGSGGETAAHEERAPYQDPWAVDQLVAILKGSGVNRAGAPSAGTDFRPGPEPRGSTHASRGRSLDVWRELMDRTRENLSNLREVSQPRSRSGWNRKSGVDGEGGHETVTRWSLSDTDGAEGAAALGVGLVGRPVDEQRELPSPIHR